MRKRVKNESEFASDEGRRAQQCMRARASRADVVAAWRSIAANPNKCP